MISGEVPCDGCKVQPAIEPCNVCGGDYCQDCLDSHDCGEVGPSSWTTCSRLVRQCELSERTSWPAFPRSAGSWYSPGPNPLPGFAPCFNGTGGSDGIERGTGGTNPSGAGSFATFPRRNY